MDVNVDDGVSIVDDDGDTVDACDREESSNRGAVHRDDMMRTRMNTDHTARCMMA
jgi:hypothetical protein